VAERHPITIAEIAALAGASTRDVALALALDSRVKPELRQRVAETIESSGYRPFEAIQTRLGRSLRIAIICKIYRGDDPEANRFYAPVAGAIAIACAKHGAEIRQATMSVNDQCELLALPSIVTDGSCDAAFLLGAQLDAREIDQVRATGCPIILVDGYSEGDGLDSVVVNNVMGAKMAVEHLIAAGHREIALLGTGGVCYPSIEDRRTGYSEALAAHGLPTRLIDGSYVYTEAAAVLGVDYVQRHPAVTAVFAVTDLVMVSFMQLARDAGLRLPADLSLVGFDDIDLASLVMPALTTLAVAKPMMGRAAFALLEHRLEEPAADPIAVEIVPRLVERESVVAPRNRSV
jgi:DNA-binding LacI/PurR family transcriptional regulator